MEQIKEEMKNNFKSQLRDCDEKFNSQLIKLTSHVGSLAAE